MTNKKDIVVIDINGNTLTFYCDIIEFNDKFIKFIDIKNIERIYNINYVVSVSRSKDG